jgi:NADH dehydrogenase
MISKAYGKNKWVVPAPALPIKILAMLLDSFPWFPISKDQLNMLMEGNICNSDKTYKDFNFKPKPFIKENLSYLIKK